MATRSDTVQSGADFRDKLNALATNGEFSDAERKGFYLLFLFYADRLASFQNAPRFGEDSSFYDNPKHWSDVGSTVAGDARPGESATQQPIYDAANNGGDALEAVTGEAKPASFLNALARSATSVQGALLLKGARHG